jgi:hypothetical protein
MNIDDYSQEELERMIRAYADELREAALRLREGAERWRMPRDTAVEIAERLGAQWLDPASSMHSRMFGSSWKWRSSSKRSQTSSDVYARCVPRCVPGRLKTPHLQVCPNPVCASSRKSPYLGAFLYAASSEGRNTKRPQESDRTVSVAPRFVLAAKVNECCLVPHQLP